MLYSVIILLCLAELVVGLDRAATASRLLTSGPPVQETEAAVIVTSDTLDYCKTLAHKVSQTLHEANHAPAPLLVQIKFLEHEGERLCANGHVRTGIAQERRALVVLMHS